VLLPLLASEPQCESIEMNPRLPTALALSIDPVRGGNEAGAMTTAAAAHSDGVASQGADHVCPRCRERVGGG